MGDEQGQSGIAELILFLDENHCRNPHIIQALEECGIACEKHLDHFAAGIEDTEWLPIIAQHGWSLLTTDARIRTNLLEKEAVRSNGIRMFYFSRKNLAGREMGVALRRALPQMQRLVNSQPSPFTASINKNGDVTLRDTFRDE
jgi:PIN like domain